MEYECFSLLDIDLSKIILVKEVIKNHGAQDHSRWIFRSRGSIGSVGNADVYLKVWNPTYLRAHNILLGLDTGFYDHQTVPALIGLIFHRGVCRGYITHRCKYHRNIDQSFYRLIQQKTVQTGLFYVQHSRYHIMRYRNKYSLIDLEGIYPLNEFPNMPLYHTVFDDAGYGKFVFMLYCQSYPDEGLQLSDYLLPSQAPAVGVSRLSRSARFARRKLNAIRKHLNTWILENRGLRKTHLSLIEV